MTPSISGIVLYVKDIPRVSAFYRQHFGFTAIPGNLPGWQRLASRDGGCSLMLHQAAKSQKSGAAMKIVFSVPDVECFISERRMYGLEFGPIHQGKGYVFANAKDPAGNSISISDREYRSRTPNHRSDPTSASGTSPAVKEPRLR
jgi:predicted enzyme related to lactoylglutathione lyase